MLLKRIIIDGQEIVATIERDFGCSKVKYIALIYRNVNSITLKHEFIGPKNKTISK